MRYSEKIFFIFFVFFFAAIMIAISAQSPLADMAVSEKKNSKQILRVTKEFMHFDIYWVGVYVGKATLEAVNDKGNITIISKVNSAPVISQFYKVDDHARSEIADGKPISFKIRQHEGRYRSNKETIFDMNNNRIIYFNHLQGKKFEHALTNQPLWDVISGFYYLRTYPFELGKSVYVGIFDSNKFYNAEVRVVGKEKVIVSDNWKADTIIIKPILQSDGLFKKKGDIHIWLTDDENRIPVKVETTISIGKVTAKLRTFEIQK